MVPGAGQDAVLNASTLEREAHMRAAVVYDRDPATIIDDEDWAVRTVQDQPSLGLQLDEPAGVHEVWAGRVRGRLWPLAIPALGSFGPV